MFSLIKKFKEEGISQKDVYSALERLYINDIDILIEEVKAGRKIDFEQERSILLFRKMQQEELIKEIYENSP